MVGIVLIMSLILLAIVSSINEEFINSFFGDQGVYSILLKASGILFFMH
jgi:hypothetical protein